MGTRISKNIGIIKLKEEFGITGTGCTNEIDLYLTALWQDFSAKMLFLLKQTFIQADINKYIMVRQYLIKMLVILKRTYLEII